jgi:hypothetical protein
MVILVIALTDSTIRVALERDFFHRDTLHLLSDRPVVYAVALVFDASRFSILVPPSDLASLVSILATAAFGGGVFYAAANLVPSGNRVKDSSIRMYDFYLGIGMFLFIVTVVLFGLPEPIDYLEFVAVLFASYCVYRMATSLSPTSRIRKEAMNEGLGLQTDVVRT